MNTLYRPVPITSAEQAEALPIGTIARHTSRMEDKGGTFHQEDVAIKIDTTEWQATLYTYWCGNQTMVGWTALVPIEAEEEHEEARSVSVLHGSTWTWPARTRLVTPWRDAT